MCSCPPSGIHRLFKELVHRNEYFGHQNVIMFMVFFVRKLLGMQYPLDGNHPEDVVRGKVSRGLKRINGPFPSSCLPPLQSESKCEVFVMISSFHSDVK